MNPIKTAKPARILLIALLTSMLGLLLVRFSAEYRRSHEQGRFVSRIVQEQLAAMRRMDDGVSLVQRTTGWPDDFLALQGWLLVNLLKQNDPASTRTALFELSRDRLVSPVMRTSLRRWNESLGRWGNAPAEKVNSPGALLEEGRKLHHRAIGYGRVGRDYDASPLFLWSASLLAEFIQRDPLHSQVPEALYLLGASTLQFKRVIPAGIRPDRILNLCQEYFPHTVWAERAEELWRREMTRGV